MKVSWRHLLPLFLLFGLVVLFFLRLFYPVLTFFVTPDFGNSDLLHGYYPIKYAMWEGLKNNHVQLWNNKMGGGYPYFADGQVGSLAIINLFFYRLFSFVPATNLIFIFTFILSGLGMYLLSQEWFNNRYHSLFSSVVFTFSGFMIGQISHISLLQTASLLPFAMFATHRLITRSEFVWTGILAFIISQQIFLGNQQMVVYSMTAVGLYFIALLFIFHPKKNLIQFISKKTLLFSIAAILGCISASALLLPNYELYKMSTRTSYGSLLPYFPYPPKHLLTFLDPYYFGSPQNGTYPLFSLDWGNFWENTGYVGIIPLIMVIFGLKYIKRKEIFVLYGLLFISILLVLGKYSPLYILFQIIPWSLFRVPSRFLVFTDVLIALIAGYVLYISTKQYKKFIPALLVVITIFHFINIMFYFYNYHPTSNAYDWFKIPKTVEYFRNDKSEFRIFTIDNYNEWNNIFLKEGWKYPDKYLQFRGGLIEGSSLFYDIDKFNARGSFPIRRVDAFNKIIFNGIKSSNGRNYVLDRGALKLLGSSAVKYILVPRSINLTLPQIYLTDENRIYSNPEFVPKIRLVSDFKKVSTLTEVRNAVTDKSFNPKKEILVEDNIENRFKECNKIGEKCMKNLRILEYKDNNIIIETNTNADMLLIDAETLFPGWKATIDGNPTKIYPANIMQRLILLESGHHKIRIYYDPDSFKYGAWLSIFGNTIIVLLVLHYFFVKRRTDQKTS